MAPLFVVEQSIQTHIRWGRETCLYLSAPRSLMTSTPRKCLPLLGGLLIFGSWGMQNACMHALQLTVANHHPSTVVKSV